MTARLAALEFLETCSTTLRIERIGRLSPGSHLEWEMTVSSALW